MGSGLFGIGISGLNAAQVGLATTGHNIANASTPGFHRQEIVQSSASPQYTGAGFVGTGVKMDTVRRVYSDFLDSQATNAQAKASYFTAYSDQIAQIDNILSDPSAGLAPELEAFFQSVHELGSHPASIPSRQAMLSASHSLSARFQALDNRFIEINQGINAQLESTISGVNAYAREIAGLNVRIAGARADPNQPPNDLLDKRDELIGKLNELIGASAVMQNDGNVTVTVGNGQSLVVGGRSFALATVGSPEVPEQTDVAYLSGGTPVTLSAATLSGGSLGALLAFREEALTDARNQLGRIAAGLAESFNSQHRLGQDIVGQGNLGGDFFSMPQGGVQAHAANTGSADLTAIITTAGDLTASDYRLSYVAAAANPYQVTRLSDGTTTSYPALPREIDGVTIALSGAGVMQNGDTYLIEPTRYAARNLNTVITDPREIAAAAPMRVSAGANAGNATISPGTVSTAPTGVNDRESVTITFANAVAPATGITYQVTGASSGAQLPVNFSSPQDISYNGWSVRITGTPVAGDTFTVQRNTNGVSDNRNAALLANLQVANVLSGGTASFGAAYGQLTASVGNIAKDMEISQDAQETIALRARETQQSMSGVNLDEEAANLLRYQQAYQASGKVIQVASTLFDTILGIRA